MPGTFANALTPKENEMTNLSAGYSLGEFLNCFIMRNSSVMMGKKQKSPQLARFRPDELLTILNHLET
jgi:hypothetical protein